MSLNKILGKPPRSKKKVKKGWKKHYEHGNKKKKNPYVADNASGFDDRLLGRNDM